MLLFGKQDDDAEADIAPEEDLQEDAPDEVLAVAAEALGTVPVLVCSSDLTLNGDFETIWLLATERKVVVVSPRGDTPEVLRQFSLADLESLETEKFIGNAVLRGQVEGERRDLIRFSLTLFDKFEYARERLEDWRKALRGESQGRWDKGPASNRCPKCHQTIPAWAEKCPNCKPKAQVLLRALRYLFPWWHLSLLTLILMFVVNALGLAGPLFMKVLLDDVFSDKKIALSAEVDEKVDFIPTVGSPKGWPRRGDERVLEIEGERIRYTTLSLEEPFGFRGCQRGADGTTAAAHAMDQPVRRPPRPVSQSLRLLFLVVAGILATRVASTALGALRAYLMRYLGEKIIMGLRQQIYGHLHRLSLGFYDQQQTGSLMYKVNADTGRLQGFIAGALQDLLRHITTAIIICVVLFKMHAVLALMVLGPVPFIVWGSRQFGKRMHRIYHRVWRIGSAVNAVLADAIPGVRVVKAFDKERFEVRRYAHMQHAAFRVSMQASLMSNVFYPALGLLTMLGTLSIWGYGGYVVLTGQGGGLTVGALVAFLTYARRFYQPINQLARFNDQIQRVSTSAERVFEILDAHPDVADRENALTLQEVKGHIVFEDVYFAYPDNDPVIKGLSMEIHPGEMVGVVGPSGAGKTTLINLICRFYDVTGGKITLDGHDLRDISVHSLRSNIGVVLQEPYLFQGTIEENITYGRPDATREEVLRAAEAAYALDIILHMDDGFDQLVGERGTRLSGGQKQRLSIARAILRNPKLLILDEATSAVDTETEDRIRRALESLVQNRTTIAIAHRLSTLRRASRLAVLERGELVEMGTHEELLAKEDGLFKRLWSKQMSVAAEETLATGALAEPAENEAELEPLDQMQELDLTGTTFASEDESWLRVESPDGLVLERVRPVRAFPLSAPWEMILFCDEEDRALAFLKHTRQLPHESFQVLYRCLFWRYFMPQILEIQSVAIDSGSATKWEVTTNRGERVFQVKKRHDVRSITPRRLIVTDSEGNRYDLPDYGKLPAAGQLMLERLQFV